jgi:serine/threonine protein kinase
MSKLIGQGAYGCVYHPAITCSGKTSKSANYITKLVVNDKNAVKENDFGKLISKIKNFKKFFSPVVKFCPANLKAIKRGMESNDSNDSNDSNISRSPRESCEVIEKHPDSSFLLTYVWYINGSVLGDHFNILPYDAEFILNLIKTYAYLVNSLQILYNNGILHYDLKSDNIMYDKEKNIPIIIDFGLSIETRNIIMGDNSDLYNSIEQFKRSFFVYAPDYDVWCPEINIICFILYRNDDNDAKFLTVDRVKSVLDDTISQNGVLRMCSEEFRVSYYNAFLDFMNPLIGMDNMSVIQELIKYMDSWDVYSLSITFIKMFTRKETRYYSDSGARADSVDFFKSESLLMQTFFLSISPYPNKRPTFEGLKKIIFNDFNVKI